jgi:hypothetical protein
VRPMRFLNTVYGVAKQTLRHAAGAQAPIRLPNRKAGRLFRARNTAEGAGVGTLTAAAGAAPSPRRPCLGLSPTLRMFRYDP